MCLDLFRVYIMGQAVARETIGELKDVTLKGVVPLKKELGRGAYGSVFTVKYGGSCLCCQKDSSDLN